MADRIHHLNAEIARVQARIDDLNKLIEQRNHELNCKHHQLDECQRSLAITREGNQKNINENNALRRDNDRLAAECHETVKELQCTEARNSELVHNTKICDDKLKQFEH